MLPAIYYHPVAFDTSKNMTGMSKSGESFIKAISKEEEFYIYSQSQDDVKNFAKQLFESGGKAKVNQISDENLVTISKLGCLFAPSPGLGIHANKRALIGADAYSICGITHMSPITVALDLISDYISKPVYPWDALICTSEAIKKVVEKVLQAEANRMESRLGAQRVVLPQLPVIPLGIHTEDYRRANKLEMREKIAIDENRIVVLNIGRLSPYDKAHPITMYKALEETSKRTGKKITLIQCGVFRNDILKQAYRDFAFKVCPSVEMMIMDGANQEEREIAWAVSDIFCSFADTFQEVFGLAPVEAMASGLPVVVSDWGGYAECVTEDTGFKISTTMPAVGQGGDIAFRNATGIDNYDMFNSKTSSLVNVDIEAAVEAFCKLVESAELREKMGKAGEKRAKEIYDWEVVMPQYKELWKKLAEIRESHKGKVREYVSSKVDPFKIFEDFGSVAISEDTILKLASDPEKSYEIIKEYKNHNANKFANSILPTDDEFFSMICGMREETKASESVMSLDKHRQAIAYRALNWLLKMGIIKIVK